MREVEAIPSNKSSFVGRITGIALIVVMMIAVLVVGASPANAGPDEKETGHIDGGPIFVMEY